MKPDEYEDLRNFYEQVNPMIDATRPIVETDPCWNCRTPLNQQPDGICEAHVELHEQTQDRELEDVRRFYQKIGVTHTPRVPTALDVESYRERIGHLREELREFEEAVAAGDLAKQADALVDLVYVAKGTAMFLGLPWRPLWEEVQSANMAKVPGSTHRSQRIDAAKPPGWRPPRIELILALLGWRK